MLMPKSHRIALLFNANKIFDREVIAGLAAPEDLTRAYVNVGGQEVRVAQIPANQRAVIASKKAPNQPAPPSRTDRACRSVFESPGCARRLCAATPARENCCCSPSPKWRLAIFARAYDAQAP